MARKQKVALTRWLVATCLAPAALSAAPAAAQLFNPTELTSPSQAPPRAGGVLSVSPRAPRLEPPKRAKETFVRVRRISIGDAFPELAAENAAFAERLAGQRLSVAEIYAAAQELEDTYRKTFPLAEISIPAQNFADGVVRIDVEDGFIESIDLSEAPERSRDLIRARVANLLGKRHLTLGEYQRSTMLVGTLAGVSGAATIKPSDTAGAYVLLVGARENRVSATTSIDNRLPKYLGPWQFSQSAALNNAFGFGEQISFTAASGPDFNRYFAGAAKSQAYVFDVGVPIGPDGFMIGASYVSARARASPLPNALPPELEVLGERNTGLYERVSARAAYPLILSAERTLKSQLTFDHIFSRSSSWPDPLVVAPLGPVFDGYRDRYDAIRVSADGAYRLPWEWGGSLNGLAVYSHGLGGRATLGPLFFDPTLSRPNAQPIFNRSAGKLRLNLGLPEDFQFTAIARAQTNFDQSLMITENMSLDGLEAVSGFASGTLNADRGFTFRSEITRPLRIELMEAPGVISPYAFFAWGRGVHQVPYPGERPSFWADTYGGGLRANTAITGAPFGETFTLEFGKSFSNILFRESGFRTNFALNIHYAGNPLDPDVVQTPTGVTKGDPAPSTSPQLWSGFYAGLNAGYSWDPRPEFVTLGYPAGQQLDNFFGLIPIGGTLFPISNFAAASVLGASGISRASAGGFAGGGQLGQNYQSGRFVVGFETDLQGSNLRARSGFTNVTNADFLDVLPGAPVAFYRNFPATTSVQHEKSVDWLGTLRGRVGYTVTPTLLAYVTGGLAYGGVSASTFMTQHWGGSPVTNVLPPLPAAASLDLFLQSAGSAGHYAATRVGWTLGGGLEWMFARNLSLKFEYLYYDLGGVTYKLSPLATSSNLFGPTPANFAQATTRTQFAGDIARLGLNYHFNDSTLEASTSPPAAFGSSLYAGFNAGYSWDATPAVGTNAAVVSSGVDDKIGADFSPMSVVRTTGLVAARADGMLSGGQIGYNHFIDKYMVGVETDIQGASFKGRSGFRTATPLTFLGANVGAASTVVENTKSLDWFGTVRGRAGYQISPTLLGYATGGFAYGLASAQTNIADQTVSSLPPNIQYPTNAVGNYSDVRFGWALGAGLEWLFGPNLSFKAEYLYQDLGSVRYKTSTMATLLQRHSCRAAFQKSPESLAGGGGVCRGHERGACNWAISIDAAKIPCGNVAQCEEEFSIGRDQVAVVAADWTKRRIVITGLPAAGKQAEPRQEVSLDLGSQIKIALQGGEFGRTQMVQAVANQRVGQQPILFNRIVALFAEAEGAFIHALQRRIDFTQQAGEARILRREHDGLLQSLFTRLQLIL